MSISVTSTPFLVSVSDDGSLVTVAANGPAGQGVPAGGSTGQVLKKSSGTNYATEWASGGTGDLLASNNLSEVDATAARSNLSAAATNHNHSAGNITSGTLSTDRIPDLAASKITSGTIATARIPTLSTSSITGLGDSATKAVGTSSGTVCAGDDSRLSDARTPVAHSADLVTSGTLGVDRIPTITLAKVSDSGTAASKDTGTGSSNVILGNDARLTDARTPTTTLDHDADKITSGTLTVARGGTGSATAPMIGVVTAANASAARSTLGLGTAATTDATNYAGAIHTHTLANISDSGTAAAAATTDFATAAQGTKANSAMQDLVDDTGPQLGANLDVLDKTITTTTTNGNLALLPKGSGWLEVGGSATSNLGKIRLMCEAGSHGVGLKSPPHTAAANYDLVLPTATGSANQALKTDGSGNLGWASYVAASAVSTFGGTLVDDATAGDARTTLGATTVGSNVFTAASQAAARSAIGVGTGTGDMVGSNNLSDVDSVTTARTNLGATTVGANVFTAADAAAARSAIGAGSGTGDLVASNNLSDLNSAATARTNLGITNTGSYTGQIETAANKTYTLDPAVATARTISAFYVKTGAGSVVVNLKNGSNVVKQVTAGTGTGDQTSLANTSLAADAVLTLVLSSNSSATDVIFSVEYTE